MLKRRKKRVSCYRRSTRQQEGEEILIVFIFLELYAYKKHDFSFYRTIVGR